MGELDEDALGLFADDVDLLHARYMQQALTQGLGVAHQVALRLAPGFEREQGEGDVRILIVDQRADHPGRQRLGLVADLLARLVELLEHLRGWGGVEQRQGGEGQPRACIGFAAVVPAQFLQALLDLLGDLILHFLGGGARPGGDDGHDLDGEGRVFGTPQLEEGDETRQGDQADQEQGDGALAHGECGEVETTFAHGWPSSAAATVAGSARRTAWPSRSRCAPRATIWSPGLIAPLMRALSSSSD